MTSPHRRTLVTYPFVLVAVLFFLSFPGFFSNIGLSNSHALGMIFSVIPIALISLVTRDWMPFTKREFQASLVLLSIILLHFLCVSLVGGIDTYSSSSAQSRFVLSFVLLVIFLWAAFQLERYISALEKLKFTRLIVTIYWLLVVLALASLPFHWFDWVTRKQMLIFSEPSHFAVVFSPFLFYQILTSSHRYKHLFLCFSLALLLQNVTLIVTGCLGILLSVKRYGIFKILSIFMLVLFVAVFITYFRDFFGFLLSRNILDPDSQNLSVLVFLSGLERAYITTFESYFLGVGFQQMGVIGPLGELQTRIMSQTDGDLMNIFEGGSLFSKLTVEFGVMGILCCLAYLVKAVRIFRLSRSLAISDNKEIFYMASFLSIFILLFVRSVGYFTPSSFLVLVGLVGLSRLDRRRTRSIKESFLT
tara:strand:+ start:3745 stop:5001 length:1257 start_codon:yes stop_codon:yes gene_type:complete